MSTDNEYYREKPYEEFDAMSYEFHQLIKDGQIGPWYFCNVETLGRWRNDIELVSLSALGFKITKWWLKNKKEDSKIIYLPSEGDYLVFDNEPLMKQFKRWYKKQDITGCSDTKLWPDNYDFHETVEETGKAHIEQKISMKKVFDYYETNVLTGEIFDIYCWMEDNLGEVYYWGYDFYFVDETDAVAFKLKWIE